MLLIKFANLQHVVRRADRHDSPGGRIAVVEGVRKPGVAVGLIDAERFDSRMRDLYRVAESDGTFCHTFFKAVGVVV